MTILINASSAKMGGNATYAQNLMRFLLASPPHGMSFIVIVPTEPWTEEFLPLSSPFLTIMRMPAYRSFVWQLLWQQFGLRRIIIKKQVSLLFSTANFGMFFPPCRQILFLRNALFFSSTYKKILSQKTFFKKCDFFLRKQLVLLSIAHSHTLLTASRSMRDDVATFCARIKKDVVVNTFGTHVDDLKELSKQRTPSPHIRLLCTSHYDDYKNYSTLFKALLALNEKNTIDFRFTAPINIDLPLFKKSSSYQTDSTLIEKLKKRLALTGPLPYQKLLELYRDVDIFLWPSLVESFGHPLIEAMAAGLPIIASDIPINREICEDAALYFNSLDEKDFEQKIILLANDRELQKKLVEEGAKRISLFHWEDHAHRLLECFRLMAKPPLPLKL